MRAPPGAAWWLLAAALVALATGHPLLGLVGVGAALGVALLARARRPAAPEFELPPRPPGRLTPTEVICTRATPERQEWVSSRTGRLYDVLARDGLPGARPGDRGRVRLSGSSWRIEEP